MFCDLCNLFQAIHESTFPNQKEMQTFDSYFLCWEQFVANDMKDKSELSLSEFPKNISKKFAVLTTNRMQPRNLKIIYLFKPSFQIMKLEF